MTRRRKRSGSTENVARKVYDMAVDWDDLSESQKTALRRMNRGPYPELPEELAGQLIALGLAERRATGVGINRAGRELTIDALLRTRKA